jgi:hypothetical protein
VESLRVIDSPVVAGLLLLILGAGFVALADRIRSQTLAAATIALTFYTSAINPVQTFSLFSNLVVSAAAIALLARRRWRSISFLSLVGTYGSFAFWRFQQAGMPAAADTTFWPAVLFPAAYWLVHTAAAVLRRVDSFDPASRPVFLTLNNAAFFALAAPVVARVHPDWFWVFTALYGAALMALSLAAARRSHNEPWFDGAYLAQGLGLVLLALLYKFTGWQQAIGFALLGATLVSAGRLRHGAIFRFFAAVCAVVAACSVAEHLVEAAPHARLVAGVVAGILAFSAWLLKRQSSRHCDWRALGFALLAAILCAAGSVHDNLQANAVQILAIALVAGVGSRFIGTAEFAYAAQPLAFFGQALLLVHAGTHDIPASALTLSAAFALANVHDWQWRTSLAGARIWASLHALAPEVLALWWITVHLTTAQQGPACALTSLLLLAYGAVTRNRILRATSAPFAVATLVFTFHAIDIRAPWISPAISMALLVAQSLLFARITSHTAPSLALRGSAVCIGIAMVFAYIASTAWFAVLALAALAFFATACVRPGRELALYAGILFAISASTWAFRLLLAPAQGIDLAGFAAMALAQQLGRRRPAKWFPRGLQVVFCTVAVVGTWITVHRLVEPSAGGFLLTVAWSLLAFLVLGGGFLLRERTYRILGLAILAAAVARVFCIDVWQLETLHRILSFLVLGGVLLALGFLYNRYADALRRWL